MKTTGRLERVLAAGGFAITAETTPRLTADPADVVARTAPLKGLVDAVNVTDGAGAKAHLSSMAAAHFMARENGLEAVMQFTARDRNKLGLERELLGVSAFGFPNLLCLSGDPIDRGDEPEATAVNDLDSIGMIALAASMRDQGKIPSGREIAVPPRYLIGAADMPIDPPAGWTPDGLERKIAAGADFVQTQFCFDMEILARYIAGLDAHGIPDKIGILIGIGPLASARQARWMRDNLYGTIMPDALIDRLEASGDERAEGRKICAELLQELADMAGVAGAHLMGPGAEEGIADAIALSGLRS